MEDPLHICLVSSLNCVFVCLFFWCKQKCSNCGQEKPNAKKKCGKCQNTFHKAKKDLEKLKDKGKTNITTQKRLMEGRVS